MLWPHSIQGNFAWRRDTNRPAVNDSSSVHGTLILTPHHSKRSIEQFLNGGCIACMQKIPSDDRMLLAAVPKVDAEFRLCSTQDNLNDRDRAGCGIKSSRCLHHPAVFREPELPAVASLRAAQKVHQCFFAWQGRHRPPHPAPAVPLPRHRPACRSA